MANSLQDLAAGFDLRLKSYRPGHTENGLLCPSCGGGRTKEKSLNVTVDADGQGLVFSCKRGSCGHSGGKRLQDAENRSSRRRPEDYQAPPPRKSSPLFDDDDAMTAFFAARGIGQDTIDVFGIYTEKRFFKAIEGEAECLVFPYLFECQVVNRKYRGLNDKQLMMQEKNPLPTLFNIDAVTDPDVLLFCEGEMDVMALHEAGYRQTVSLKDGAPAAAKVETDPEAKRFLALGTHAELLTAVKKIILAGDMDEPGVALREELARRLGRHRCWIVTWPNDCKDANDTLIKHGKEWVQSCVEKAKPFPIEGVQEVTGEGLDFYLELPPPMTMTTGVSTVDDILRFPGEGRCIVITGMPNSGKSKYTSNVMIHTMRTYKRKWLVFSPEMQPFEEFAVEAAEILVGKSARRRKDRPFLNVMTREERQRAGNWLNSRMQFLSTDQEDCVPTIDWLLEKAINCVLRFGTTDLLVDPFNEIEATRGNLSETDFIGRCLQRFKAFGLRYGCNVWVVAHPAKMRAARPGEKIPAPGPYDISGSAHWANKPDLGITIFTPDNTTQVILWKSRFSRWGRKGKIADLQYDEDTGRYSSPELDLPPGQTPRQIAMGEF